VVFRLPGADRYNHAELFGVTKGWPATDAGTGIHMDLPDGYISIDSVAGQKGVITHFAVAVDHMDAAFST